MLRGWIERRLAGHPAISAIDRAIGSQGFRVVLLVRLCSLLPYDLMSYALGLTKVSLRRYLLGTWLGRLPEIVFWAYIGSTAKSWADAFAGKVHVGIGGRIFLGLGIAAMIAAMFIVTKIARKALREVSTQGTQARAACYELGLGTLVLGLFIVTKTQDQRPKTQDQSPKP